MRLFSFLRRLISDRRGLATLELAMMMPLFAGTALMIADLGERSKMRMELDQGLRAGAQVAMLNVTQTSDIQTATLKALGENAVGTDDLTGVCNVNQTCISASFRCECSSGTSSACDAICPATDLPPSTYLDIAARRRHDGLILPMSEVYSQMTVQLR